MMTTEPLGRLQEERDRVEVVHARAAAIEVTNAEQNTAAGKLLEEVKGRAKDMDALRKSMTRPLDESKRRIMDLFRPIEEQLAADEQHIKGQMLDYLRQEQRRIDAERAAADAERARLASEAHTAASEGRYADALVAAEDSLAVAEPPKAPQRAAGTSVITTWRAEVIDFQALLLAVATGEAPLGLVRVDQQAIDAMARATKAEGVAVPGVRFYREDSLRGRAGGLR